MSRHPTVAAKWKTGSGWAGVGLKRRATDGDRVRMYKLLYRDMCDASHSGYGSLEYALVDLDGDPKIRYGNMEPDEGPAVLAAVAVLVIVGSIVDTMKLARAFGERSTSITRAMTSGSADDTPKSHGTS